MKKCGGHCHRPSPDVISVYNTGRHSFPFPHLVGHSGVLHAPGKVDGELRAVEDVDGRRPLRQRLSGRRCPDDGALPRLWDSVVTRVKHAEPHLKVKRLEGDETC